MTPQEFNAALAELRLTRTALRHLLDLDKSTLTRWGTGETTIPTGAALVVLLLLRKKVTLGELFEVKKADAVARLQRMHGTKTPPV